MQTEIPVSDCSQQTDDNLVSEIELLKAENSRLKQSIFSLKLISGNDVSTRFYTGLPSYVVFLHLYTFLSPYVNSSRYLPLDEVFLNTSEVATKPGVSRFIFPVFNQSDTHFSYFSEMVECNVYSLAIFNFLAYKGSCSPEYATPIQTILSSLCGYN